MKTKDIIVLVTLGLVFSLIFIINSNLIRNLNENFEGQSISFEKENATALEWEGYISFDEKARVTLWKCEDNIEILGSLHLNPCKTNLYTINGECRDVFPTVLIYGSYLTNSDTYGCLLDINTSLSLFGSENAIGETIKVNDKEYIVRGILSDKVNGIVIVTEDDNMTFSNIEVSGYKNDASTFIFFDDFFRISGTEFYESTSFISSIPILLLCLFFFIISIKNRKNFYKKKIYSYIISAIFAILSGTFFILSIKEIPSAIIPSMWSDFDFFSDKIKVFQSFMHSLVYSVSYYKQYKIISLSSESILFSSLEIVVAVIIMIKIRKTLTESKSQV